jgi:hypothetical protein
MAFAPSRGTVAAGEGAAAVAQDEGSAEWAGEETPGPAEVEHVTVSAEHSRHDAGVAGEPSRLGDADGRAAVEPARLVVLRRPGVAGGRSSTRRISAGL